MNRQQLLLGKLAEEAVEVALELAKLALKTQQFGMLECMPTQPLTNAQRIHAELNDLTGIVQMLNDEFNFGYVRDPDAIAAKIVKVNKYAEYSKSLGELQDETLDKKEIPDV